MRGLDIRIRYAQAKIMKVLDIEDTDNELYFAEQDAYGLGRNDFERGQSDVPALFQGEAELVDAWLRGWDDQAEHEVMRNCQGCNTGGPCPIHG